MRKIFDWIIRNLSNIFGIIGILLTLYFGVVYVPTWYKEDQNEKLNSAQQQSIQSIKELVYNDSTVTVNEITAIVYAKELDEKVTIPYTFYEILTLTQNSFMEDKYLSLNKRKELIREIEQLKTKLLPEQAQDEIKKNKASKSSFDFLTIFSIVFSIITGVVGLVSIYFKVRLDKEKQEEISNEVEQSTIDISFKDFENNTQKDFIAAIKDTVGKDVTIPKHDEGYDLHFTQENKQYYVEFKILTKSKVGLGSFKQFLNRIKDQTGEAWFIYNTDLTPLVEREAKQFSESNRNIVLRLLKVNNKNELQDKVKDLLHAPVLRNVPPDNFEV